MISVPFELEQVEFGIPGIPVPEKSQKECGLRFEAFAVYKLNL